MLECSFYNSCCVETMEESPGERWEALAEVHFSFDGDITDDNYIYCLCSRVFIRNGVKQCTTELQPGSESDGENKIEDSHVHFSQDTTYREKFEKEDVASCYCSASHTENNYSTDEHDTNAPRARPFQPSDSGADLTCPDTHSDEHASHTNTHTPPDESHTTNDISMEQDSPTGERKVNVHDEENYLNYITFEKYWQDNGERLIWASWINQYSDYINPTYLDEENDGSGKDNSDDHINSLIESETMGSKDNEMRERKFSYDSRVNPYKSDSQRNTNEDEWVPTVRKRSSSEHERLLSPRTIAPTDSMTNVTKITVSSCDMNSSHVTSESSRSEDYSSVSSSSSADPSNDQTRVCIGDDNTMAQPEEIDPDQYWQMLWKKHFGEQYDIHYANYIESHMEQDLPSIDIEVDPKTDKKYIECENSDGNSQDLPSVVEVLKQVECIQLDDKKKRKRNVKTRNYVNSVGVLLQTLLNEENNKSELMDGGDGQTTSKNEHVDSIEGSGCVTREVNSLSLNRGSKLNHNQDGDEPPEDRPIKLKRRHESDTEEAASEKVSSVFTQMGLSWENRADARCELVYSKKMYQLRPPRFKGQNAKKTYFDEDGTPYNAGDVSNEQGDDIKKSQLDSESQTREEGVTNDIEPETEPSPLESEAFEVTSEPLEQNETDTGASEIADVCEGMDTVKRKRRKHRKNASSSAMSLPEEVSDDPKLKKYWLKRHSLFHRFDEGIRLDKESWFSVTPEKVAKHLAERCRCDVIVDAFCGAGGNTIQFALTCERVIAIDIDPLKIELARHNATVYGLADRIEFIVGDFFELAPTLKADVVFLSPPWGGPQYSKERSYDVETMLEPRPASVLLAAARTVSANVALYVPRTSRSDQLVELAKACGAVEIEQNFLGRRLVALAAYYGELVN